MERVTGIPGRAGEPVPVVGDNEKLERVTGIEPVPEAWEASILPLNYTRSPSNYGARLRDSQAQNPEYF